MNSQTVNAALKRAGFGGVLVFHGLRSIASTTLNEQGFHQTLSKPRWHMWIKMKYVAPTIAVITLNNDAR